MALSEVKSWIEGETLTASDLNAEFDNIYNNQQSLGTPRTAAWDMDGQELIFDADGDTTIHASTDDQIDVKIAGADDFRFVANIFRSLSGSVIETNTIDETSSGSGVTVDGALIKDGAIYSSAFKIITTTRDISTASGTQSVTGVGFTPRAAIILSAISAFDAMSVGVDDGTTHVVIGDRNSVATGTWGPLATHSIYIIRSASDIYQGAITAFTSDGCTITWTKTGSPTGTAQVYILFLR